MHYHYRWQYALGASFCVIFIGFFYYIYPDWQMLSQLKQECRQLRQHKMSVEQTTKKARLLQTNQARLAVSSSAEAAKSITDLFVLLQTSGLIIGRISDMDFFMNHPPVNEKFHLELTGRFHQYVSFFQAAIKQGLSIRLENFIFQPLETGAFIMRADFMFPHFFTSSISEERNNTPLVLPAPHAFCLNKSSIFFNETRMAKEQTVMIAQMKMIGHVQQGRRHQAWLMLPDGSLVAVEKGAVIGKEQGRVIEINQHHVLVKLPHLDGPYILALTNSE